MTALLAKRTVLLGFADALAAPEAAFSLMAAGCQLRVFMREGARPLLARRLPVGDPIVLPAPERDAAAATAALSAAVAADPAIDAVLPLDDAALWLTDAAFGDRPREAPPRIAGAAGPQARFALDKRLQIEAAAASGFEPPPTRVLDRAGDAAAIDVFPAIVKSALAGQVVDGRLRRGGAIYLENAAARDAAAFDGVLFPALAQPLIAGVGEGLFGFAGPDGVTAWSAHRRLRMMNPHGSGASACVSRAPDAAQREAGARLIAAIGWRGPFMIEFLRGADGRVWFMEFNGRLWGSTALARRGGLEYPAWAAAAALDPAFSPQAPEPAAGLAARHLGRDLLHLLFTLRGPKTAFHRAGWPSLRRSALAALAPAGGRGFYNYDPAYPWFFLEDAAMTVARALRRR